MSNSFDVQMSKRSDLELVKILMQKNDYVTDAVDAAKSELHKRNLTEEQLYEINSEISLQELERKKNEKSIHNDIFYFLTNLISPSLSFFEKRIDKSLENKEFNSPYDKFLFFLFTPTTIINSLATAIIIRVILEFNLFETIYVLLNEKMFDISIFIVIISVVQISIAIALFKKKRIGWILLHLLTIISIVTSLYYYYTWLYYEGYIPNFFSWQQIKYFILALIIPSVTLYYIHTRKVLNLFMIDRKSKFIALTISILIGTGYVINTYYLESNGYI